MLYLLGFIVLYCILLAFVFAVFIEIHDVDHST